MSGLLVLKTFIRGPKATLKPNFKIFTNFSSFSVKKLAIEPQTCLHDESIQIKCVGLSPGLNVTISSSISDVKGHDFFASAHYKANELGIVDLSKDDSTGGSYTGVFPMGLITCLKPAPHEHKYLRFFKKELVKPLKVKFQLLSGHLVEEDAFKDDSSILIDSITHERIYVADGVERIPVSKGKIRGALFLPPGAGPFPGVIDMFGTAGGLVEYRAAQLASRGFAALSLAYFQYEDLQEGLDALDISYFEEAVNFLLSNSKVKPKRVGAVGVSKGGDVACSMGTFIPEVKAVVCINGIPVNTWCPLTTKDHIYPGLHFDTSRGKVLNPELIRTLDMLDDSEAFPETQLPLHEADAQFLFLVSLDDQNWRTELENDRAIRRLQDKGKTNCKILKYKGAGHLLEPPYSPFCLASYHRLAGMALLWGGNPYEHCAAQVQSWKDIIAFLHENLE